MPFIENKIECSVCKGKGEYHYLGTFNRDRVPPVRCEECRGDGYKTIKIQVNPPAINIHAEEIEKNEDEVIKTSKIDKKEKKERVK